MTVLFADVAGSTGLGESLDPEDLRALLTRFFAVAREAVESRGGTVEKYIGDAAMAIFGLPVAHGDDAERALSAALAIRDGVRDDPRLGDRLPIRVGVQTGEVVATRADDGDRSEPGTRGSVVTGDPVNTAARLQSAAPAWGVLVGERTARAAWSAFAFGEPVELDLRGRSASVGAYPLIGAHHRPAPRMALVGREADLAQLELVAARVVRERRPYLVSIIAPAGTGKTRLAEEFLDRLPAIAPGATVALTQCLPYGERLTYWPLRALLHRLAGIDEEAPPARVRQAITDWLVGLGAEDAPAIADRLAATVGAGEHEALDPGQVHAAWRDAFELAAAQAPLVLVLEDLHWSSDSLLDLVEALLAPRGDLPLLAIVLTRTELLDRRPGWGGGRRNYLAMALEPLDEEATATLVRQLLGAAPPALVEALVERAEGNPFYAGEMARSLLERQGLDASLDPSELLARLPDTVQATVLARLDQLPADARRVIGVGSVFGRSFRAAGVATLDPGLAPGEVSVAIDVLSERDLVRAVSGQALAFRHILIREVAYQTLPRSQRAMLHARAGRWLEDLASGREEAYAELIAYHYREAATLSAAIDGEPDAALAASAETWLRRAADVAVGAAATVEALAHLRAALPFTPPERLPELWERIGYASIDGGQAIEALELALRLGEEQGVSADRQLTIMASILTRHSRWQGSVPVHPTLEEYAALRERARALLPTVTDERAVARFLASEGFVPFFLSSSGFATGDEETEAARAAASESLRIAERLDDAQIMSAALDALGGIGTVDSNHAETIVLAQRRIAMADRLDLPEILDACGAVAWAACQGGDLALAARTAAGGLARLLPGQHPGFLLHVAAWHAYATARLGDWEATLATADRMRLTWLESERPPAGYALHGLAAALGVSRARRDERRVEAVSEVLGGIVGRYRPNSRNQLARLALETVPAPAGDLLLDAARSHPVYAETALGDAADRGRLPPLADLRSVMAVARERELPLLRAATLRALGLAAGDPDPLREALQLAEASSARPLTARLRCEIGRRSGDVAMVEAGRRMLRELGDREALDRYEADPS